MRYENCYNKKDIIKLFLAFFVISVLARILPHPSNMTPTLALALYLTNHENKKVSYLVPLTAFLISDILLSFMYKYPLIGNWMLFTYPSIIFCISLGNIFKNKYKTLILTSLSYWLITNIGAFMFLPIYTYTIHDLIKCYIAALPFLGMSLIGDSIWYVIINKIPSLSTVIKKFVLKNKIGVTISV